MDHKQAVSTVDVVLLTLVDRKLHVVLVKREKGPFEGWFALPGGYVHTESDPDSRGSARRVLDAKTGIRAPYLEQLYTFSGPDRDPRGWSFSVTYYALVPESTLNARRTENVVLMPVDKLPELAFDHREIIDFALRRVRDKSSYSALPCYLLPAEFTLTELQQTYENTMNTEINTSSFRRKLEDLDFLEVAEGKFKTGKQRPAQLYRLRKEKQLAIFDRTM